MKNKGFFLNKKVVSILCFSISVLLFISSLQAQVVKQGPALVDAGDQFTYTLNFTCPSTTSGDCDNVVFSDFLPSGLDFITGTTGGNYNNTTGEWTYNFGTVPNGGTVSVEMIVEVPAQTATGTAFENIASVTTSTTTLDSDPITTEVENGFVFNYVDQNYIVKSNLEEVIAGDPQEAGLYEIRFGNRSDEELTNMVIEDILPDGQILNSEMHIENLPTCIGTPFNYTVDIALSDGTYLSLGTDYFGETGSFTSAIDYNQYIGIPTGLTDYLGITGNAEYPVGIRLTFPSFPVNCGHPDLDDRVLLSIDAYYDTAITGFADPVLGDMTVNCATVNSNNFSEIENCGDVDFIAAMNRLNNPKTIATDNPPYEPFELIEYEIRIASFGNINGLDNTNLYGLDIIPAEFTFVQTGSLDGTQPATGEWQSMTPVINSGSTSDLPIINIIPNIDGAGATGLELVWSDANMNNVTYPAFESGRFSLFYVLQVNGDVSDGDYDNTFYISADNPFEDCPYYVTDSEDFNNNGSTTDQLCARDVPTPIIVPPGFAGLNSEKSVNGNLDPVNEYSKFPENGQVSPSGDINYSITITNPFAETIDDIVLVDVLPHVGDRGVVANDETRDSEWQPEFTATTLADLMAFVGGISGATLEFSTECEPCLSADLGAPVTDLASCATPNWSSTAPTNLTDICSFKIDFGSTFELTQDDSITLDFTMSAPAGVPTNGEIAWNSFGFVGNKENGSALLASEPIKVGIESLPSLEVCDIPLVAAYAIQASCTDGVPNNNGYLQLSTITDGDRFNWSVGSTYTGDADYANATDTTGFPIIIVDTLSNPSGSRDYTIRVFNGASNCFTDVVVTMNEQDCTIGCDCKEFLYMNDPSSGTVHKFEIHADGSTTEINPTGPWYPNGGVSGLPSPHGLGSDLNGNLYIGEGIGINMGDEGDLRRLDCDGNLYPVSNFIIENVYPRNVFSIGNYLFSNKRPSGSSGATGSDYMLVYDLCTETLVDSICFDNPTSTADASLGWGFYIYDDIVYAVTDQHELYAFDPFNYLETSTCVTPFAENVNTYSDAGNNKFGVASDGTHVYVVYAATYNGPAQVLMFDLNGNFITKTAVDNIDGDGGWYGAAAIVYSETCNCIITTSASPNEDCAYAFELDLTPMGPSVVPADIEANAGEPFEAKASAILKECCPTNNNITIDTTLCGTMIDDQIFLQELISCDGIICEGNWQAGGSNTGMTYNTCDNSITITSLMACGSFTLESDGVGNALQCGAFKITVNIEVINHPSVTLLPDSTICIGENILLYGILDTVGMPTYQWQQSTTSCTTGFANITSATDSTYLATPSDTTYFRLITSSSGACASGNCTDTSACVTIYPTELPMATVADVLKCTENSETISVSPSGGIGPYTYSWSGPSIISGQGTDEITASSPGTYTVTVMDAEGCTKTTSGEMTFQSKVCLPATFSIKRGN